MSGRGLRSGIKTALRILLLFASLGACTTYQRQGDVRIAPADIVRAIEINKTTKEQIQGMLGRPKTITTKADGVEAWVYKLTTSSGSLSGGEAEHKVLTVTFNRDGIVRDVSDKRTVSKVSLFGGMQTTTVGADE